MEEYTEQENRIRHSSRSLEQFLEEHHIPISSLMQYGRVSTTEAFLAKFCPGNLANNFRFIQTFNFTRTQEGKDYWIQVEKDWALYIRDIKYTWNIPGLDDVTISGSPQTRTAYQVPVENPASEICVSVEDRLQAAIFGTERNSFELSDVRAGDVQASSEAQESKTFNKLRKELNCIKDMSKIGEI